MINIWNIIIYNWCTEMLVGISKAIVTDWVLRICNDKNTVVHLYQSIRRCSLILLVSYNTRQAVSSVKTLVNPQLIITVSQIQYQIKVMILVLFAWICWTSRHQHFNGCCICRFVLQIVFADLWREKLGDKSLNFKKVSCKNTFEEIRLRYQLKDKLNKLKCNIWNIHLPKLGFLSF